jgi:hypothetical protein
MRCFVFFAVFAISAYSFADDHPAQQSKASEYFVNKTKVVSYSDESFSSSKEIELQSQINKVVVNDVDNPLIRYIGTPLANVGLAVFKEHRETYEIFLYGDNGETLNCYVTFEGDSEPKLSRCK